MHDIARGVLDHYQPSGDVRGRVDEVMRGLAALGDGPLTAAQLAPLDQYHALGLGATQEMAVFGDIARGERVLDAGSGLGGPSRFLAADYDCDVTGVDLTPSFVELATLLAERAGLAQRVRYEVGDIVALPFADGAFDVVWTQHVVMNVADRDGLAREFSRVLRAGGRLVFFDILAGDAADPLIFPLPWATTPQTSFLQTLAQTTATLERAGLRLERWNDLTDRAIAAMSAQLGAPRPPVSLMTVMGDRIGAMAMNLVENARHGNLRAVMGRATRG